jgi:hypothetical protein
MGEAPVQPANHALLSSHAIENRAASSDFVIKIALFRDSLESVSLGEQSMWITIAKTNAATANLCILNIEIIQTIGRIRP